MPLWKSNFVRAFVTLFADPGESSAPSVLCRGIIS